MSLEIDGELADCMRRKIAQTERELEQLAEAAEPDPEAMDPVTPDDASGPSASQQEG